MSPYSRQRLKVADAAHIFQWYHCFGFGTYSHRTNKPFETAVGSQVIWKNVHFKFFPLYGMVPLLVWVFLGCVKYVIDLSIASNFHALNFFVRSIKKGQHRQKGSK
jgi:hypothetical protein